MKWVINRSEDVGYSLSAKAVAWLANHEGKKAFFFRKFQAEKRFESIANTDDADEIWHWIAFEISDPNSIWSTRDTPLYAPFELRAKYESLPRTDPTLVKMIEVLGHDAEDIGVKLHVVEVPDNVEVLLERGEDGREWIGEVGRTWGKDI